jgi:hypothetical protein
LWSEYRFLNIFWRARVSWPLLCLFRPFGNFFRYVWIRTQRAAGRSKLARYQFSQPHLPILATHLRNLATHLTYLATQKRGLTSKEKKVEYFFNNLAIKSYVAGTQYCSNVQYMYGYHLRKTLEILETANASYVACTFTTARTYL